MALITIKMFGINVRKLQNYKLIRLQAFCDFKLRQSCQLSVALKQIANSLQ